MGKHNRKSDKSHAPGHFENQGPREQAGPPATDREEQYQRRRDQAPTDTGSRDDKIRQRAHEIWEQDGRPDGLAQQHWDRAAQELDGEDVATQRERAD